MRRLRLRSLRARLLAGVIALTAAGLLTMGAIVYAQQRSFQFQRVDDQARSAGMLVSRALDANGSADPGRPPFAPDPDHDGRGDGAGPAFSLPPGVYGERLDAAGKRVGAPVVLAYGEATPSPPKLPRTLPDEREVVTVASQNGSLKYRLTTFRRPGETTRTVLAVPLSGVTEQLHRLLLVEGLVIGAVLLLIGGVGFQVVRVGLRPLDRIGATAHKIAGGDLAQRVSPADPDTEVGRLGLSLNAMLAQIEQAFAERTASENRLRTFLADASHELRTPLSSIRGYAELFRMGAASDPAGATKAMSRIEQEAARMGVLVEDLLTLARLDEVRETVREPVDVTELARDAADDAQAAARDRSVTFHGAGDDTLVLGDADQLRQVIGNLVRNALVHTPAGTPVEIGVEQENGHVRVEVRDHGPGLPVDDGNALFERFWRADPARGRGPAGAGLGLAIVHGIVSAHGGAVRAENAAGGGARFTVELPAAGDDALVSGNSQLAPG